MDVDLKPENMIFKPPFELSKAFKFIVRSLEQN